MRKKKSGLLDERPLSFSSRVVVGRPSREEEPPERRGWSYFGRIDHPTVDIVRNTVSPTSESI
jgi:hypothetical protein